MRSTASKAESFSGITRLLVSPLQNLAALNVHVDSAVTRPSDPPRRLESLNDTCVDGREDEHRQNAFDDVQTLSVEFDRSLCDFAVAFWVSR